jgi:hypothetical protein
LQAAQGDARQDGDAAKRLWQPKRISKHDNTSDRADQGFEVEESTGNVGGDPALAEGKHRSRRDGACQH